MRVTVRPLTPNRWSDFETVFNAKGCSVARQCWCMAYRRSGPAKPSSGATRAQANRTALKALVDSGKSPGLIGYCGKIPVGWISLGPREDYAKLKRSPVMKPVDQEPVWSIVCFVVPAEYRRQGVARALLARAIEFAQRKGAPIIEAYPFDRPTPTKDTDMWFGAKSMFDKAGFKEIVRRKPARPIMRRKP